MLFDKKDDVANERILYKTKPNMLLGCKKAIFGVILLAIVFIVSPMVIQFIGEMQVYLISYIKLSLTRYAAIAFFVVILIIILYIIWQLIGWHSLEYTLTDTRIIIKSGVLSTKKNYMPYTTIQDINTSQSILARLFNVGTVSAFSAYDNNQIKLENISNPSKVEEIIFSNMMGYRNLQETPRNYINQSHHRMPMRETINRNEFVSRDDDYYDEFEPITPITREKTQFQPREYEYYPEDFTEEKPYSNYEYEPYEDNLDYSLNHDSYDDAGNFDRDYYYNEDRVNYSQMSQDYYDNNDYESNYDDVIEKDYQNESNEVEDSSETVIRRHFDKFKK